jgi:hypothetical protein
MFAEGPSFDGGQLGMSTKKRKSNAGENPVSRGQCECANRQQRESSHPHRLAV